jgi:DNA mismatch repair protein MSH5
MHEIGQLLDEEMTQEEIQDLKDAQEVFRRFLAWDIHKEMEQAEIQSGTVKENLAAVLGRT